jgi:hypothetical protein
MTKLYHLLLAIAATAAATMALPQDAERRVPVTLAGSTASSFEGSISDFEVVTYVVPLRQGQTLRVQLATNNASNCFDIHAPGTVKPIYVGGDSGSTHELHVQKSGDYQIKVFLLRLAARDGQMAQYTLELQIAG